MTENEGKWGTGGDAASDETLRRYLLCRLSDDERSQLDQRLLVDDELAEALLLAESELTDDYASGALNEDERESFKKSFLTTVSRREMLRLSTALHDYAGSQAAAVSVSRFAQPEEASWQRWLGGLFGFGHPRAWAFAGSFAVLIMLVGIAWFALKQDRAPELLITRNEPIPTSSPQASPGTDPSPSISSSPISPAPHPSPARQSIPTPMEPAVPATVATFVLSPGALRDGGDMTRVALPDGERDVIRLRLVLESGSEGVYQAEVATAEGQKVTVRSRLKADISRGDPRLTIQLPARLLQSGDYQIKLSRQKADGQLEAAGRYYFRALD